MTIGDFKRIAFVDRTIDCKVYIIKDSSAYRSYINFDVFYNDYSINDEVIVDVTGIIFYNNSIDIWAK